MPYSLVLLLSFFSGFISMSQEIIWIRLAEFMTGGLPQVFGVVLGSFLLGIATGTLGLPIWLSRRPGRPIFWIGTLNLSSALLLYLSIPLVASLNYVNPLVGIFSLLVIIFSVSLLLGGLFPFFIEYGCRNSRHVGKTAGKIYFANILGAALGPLITGFIVLEYFSLEETVLGICVSMIILAGVMFIAEKQRAFFKTGWVLISVLMILFVFQSKLSQQNLEKLQAFRTEEMPVTPFKYVKHNRNGIITVVKTETEDDIIFGGGVYDGRFSVDPIVDSNGISRAYYIATLHPSPKSVLEIGFSSGSWANVLSNYAPVEKLDIVEINPGYFEVVKHYPDNANVLKNPKVTLNIDDARRWLHLNSTKRYDLIVMNTTFHWRAHTTHLLSQEFLQLCKKHLNKNGVIYLNATGSDDVSFTVSNMFKYVTHHANFVAGSDGPFAVTKDQARENFLKFKSKGTPIFASPNMEPVLEKLLDSMPKDRGEIYRQKQNLTLITDDNMATEFKRRF